MRDLLYHIQKVKYHAHVIAKMAKKPQTTQR